MDKICLINQGLPQGSKCSCLLFLGVTDDILRMTQHILQKSMIERNPNVAHEQIINLNDLLGFADDTLVFV